MALQATFLADFASFYTAVEKAETKLKGFDSGVGGVEKSLNRMVDQFSGRKIIQDATLMAEALDRAGGISTLTGQQLQRAGTLAAEAAEKMKALGMDVPTRIQAIANAAKNVEPPLTAMSVAVGNIMSDALQRGAGALKDYATEAVFTAAKVESLGSVARFMGAQSGYTATEINALVSALVKQGISTSAANDTVIQMTRANLSLADATKLASTAQSLARANNENSSETLGKLIRAVQTLQSDNLRSIGVVVDLDREYTKFAATQGRTAESLGSTERQQIALAAVLREGERVAGVYGITNGQVGGQLQSMKRHQEEAARSIGDVFLPALRVGTEGLTEFYKLVQTSPETFALLGTGLAAAAGSFALFKGAAAAGVISAGTLATATGLIAPAAATAGTAFGGWKLGTWIGEASGATDAIERMAGRLQGLTSAQIEAGMATRKFIESEEGKKFALDQSAKALADLSAKAIEKAAADAKAAAADAAAATALKERQEETKKYNEALKNVQSSTEGWRNAVKDLDAWQLAGIRTGIENLNTHSDLAIVYKATAVEVRAVAAAIKEEKDAMQQTADMAERLAKYRDGQLQAASKMHNEYNALVVERTGTTTEIQRAAIERWSADVQLQSQRAGTWSEEFYNGVQRVAKEKIDQLKVDWSALREHSSAKLVETAERARATYEEMVLQSSKFSTATMEEFRKTAESAELAAANWNSSFSGAVDHMSTRVTEGARRMAAEAQGVALSWTEAMKLVGQGQGTMTGTIQGNWGWSGPEGSAFNTLGGVPMAGPNMNYPGFAAGVDNFPGGLAFVHKNEALVNLAPGTSVIPASKISATAGGGRTSSVVNNYFTINAGMGSNPNEIARVIKTALVDSARSSGRRLPV